MNGPHHQRPVLFWTYLHAVSYVLMLAKTMGKGTYPLFDCSNWGVGIGAACSLHDRCSCGTIWRMPGFLSGKKGGR